MILYTHAGIFLDFFLYHLIVHNSLNVEPTWNYFTADFTVSLVLSEGSLTKMFQGWTLFLKGRNFYVNNFQM